MKQCLLMMFCVCALVEDIPAAQEAWASASAQACLGCHRPDSGEGAVIPALDLPAELLAQRMLAYRTGALGGTVMPRIARGYSVAELRALAAFFDRDRSRDDHVDK
ncbi:MAG: cytochrome C [Pseudomonadota bacterium]